MNPSFDPKLRECAEELKITLRKYDVMGLIILASPTHSEFAMHPDASWSVMKTEGMGFRFRSKKEDFPSKEIQDKATAQTVHGIESMRWLSQKMFENLTIIIDQLRKHMTIVTNIGDFFK